MVVENLLLGSIEIQQEKIVTFERGIPGFPEEKEFVFSALPDTPFFVMQSVKSELYFLTINPFEFFKEYQFDLPTSAEHFLDIQEREQVAVYNIVTAQEPFSKSTVNMQAPIIVNASNRKGLQFVLENVHFAIRQPLF
jgi:flagellar assembly factor FliW